MNSVANLLIKLGILKPDLDYHFIRASMVVIFLFFGYQKWFDYEAQALVPYINHGPLIFWMYSVFGLKGATWFFRRGGMVLRGAAVCRLLEQKTWYSRRPRFLLLVSGHHHDYSFHPEWLGAFRRRFPRNDRDRRVSFEGPCSARGVRVPAATGCFESLPARERIASARCGTTPAHLIWTCESSWEFDTSNLRPKICTTQTPWRLHLISSKTNMESGPWAFVLSPTT